MSAVLKKNYLLILIGMLFLFLLTIPANAKEKEGELNPIDVTLSDSIDFHISAGTINDKATITALNNQPEISSVYIDEIKIENSNDYRLVSSETDFSKQSINTKSYNIKLLNENIDIDLSQPYQERLEFKNQEYELSTGIHITNGEIQVGQIVYTLQSEWKDYQINYELNGGTLPNDAPQSYSSGDVTSLPIPTKTGHEFLGWKDNKTLELVDEISLGSYGNKTFVAEWKSIEFKISYDTQGGNLPDGHPKKYNSLEGLNQLPIPTKEGYRFKGWSNQTTSEDEVNYIDSIPAGSTGDKKLIAHWEELPKYNISYDLNDGEFSLKSTSFYSYYDYSNYYDEYTIDYGQCDLTDIVQLSTADINQDFTLYIDNEPIQVQWNGNWYQDNFISIPEHLRKPCEMRIEYMGYELITPGLYGYKYDFFTQYTSDKDWTLPIPTKEGYEFIGWRNIKTQEIIKVIPVGALQDIQLEAMWQPL